MNDQEILANLDYVLLCFLLQHHQSYSLLHVFMILLHLISSLSLTKFLLVPYAYVSIESIDFILLFSLALKELLLISSVKTFFHF